MKLYGYVKVDTEGFGDGTESDVSLSTDREKLIESAFEDYRSQLEYSKEWETIDEEQEIFETLEEFEAELVNGYVLLQLADYHVQYEYFEREVE